MLEALAYIRTFKNLTTNFRKAGGRLNSMPCQRRLESSGNRRRGRRRSLVSSVPISRVFRSGVAVGALVVLSLLQGGATARADTRAAIADFEAGRFDEAYRGFLAEAREGDREAQYRLGTLLRDGLGISQDPEGALIWFLCAAEGEGSYAVRAADEADRLAETLESESRSKARERAEKCRSPTAGSASRQPIDLSMPELGSGGSGPARPIGIGQAGPLRVDERPDGSEFTSFFHMPKRGSLWSKALFLPADATVIGTQYMAWEFGAKDLFWDVRAVAVEHEFVVSGVLSAIWWLLLFKVLYWLGHFIMNAGQGNAEYHGRPESWREG